MNGTLERFQINGMYGTSKCIDVSLSENTLIIVGENGSGKTTFLRMLYHFLSARWLSLVQFHFHTLIATVDGEEYHLTREEISGAVKRVDRSFLAELPPHTRRRVMDLISDGEFERAAVEVERYGSRFTSNVEHLFSQLELDIGEVRHQRRDLEERSRRVREAIGAQILYLPTYRRIERELSSILEGYDIEEMRRRGGMPRPPETDSSYIELVEFGMKDVQRAVERALNGLKEFVRENLNSLTLKYLGDVVNREYDTVDMKDIADLPEGSVRAVLDRIDESILTKIHKDHVAQVINSARQSNPPTEHQKIVCHYFLKLLEFQHSLQERESQISRFCELCSEYIVDKKFTYDSKTFSFSIAPAKDLGAYKALELSDLSSGEKQIVSLFSHLYLSGQNSFFVLIDEPELSLSVPWQRRFLVDIKAGHFCKGLVATTHSPFIYDNHLRVSTHSLGEFVSF